MSAPVLYAVFSGVPSHAELQWHGSNFEEAKRMAIENSKLDPLVSLRALPLGWEWLTTVYRWDYLPGFELPLAEEGKE